MVACVREGRAARGAARGPDYARFLYDIECMCACVRAATREGRLGGARPRRRRRGAQAAVWGEQLSNSVARMGTSASKTPPPTVICVGLDAAGKTTMLHKVASLENRAGQVETSTPTIGALSGQRSTMWEEGRVRTDPVDSRAARLSTPAD